MNTNIVNIFTQLYTFIKKNISLLSLFMRILFMKNGCCFHTCVPHTRILVACLASPVLLFFVACTVYSSPKAENGVLNLSSYDFSARGVAKLDGMWEFYWGKLFDPIDFNNNTPEMSAYVHVPNTWDRYIINGKHLPGIGHATFRVKIILPKGITNFGIKLQEASSAYKLFINGKLVSSNGAVGTDKATSNPQFLPKTALFTAPNGEAEIVFQISNYHEKNGGPWHSIYIGRPEQIAKLREYWIFIEAALIGILTVIGIYHLGLFIIRTKELSSFYFFCYCLIIALRTALMGERLLISFIPNFPWELSVRLEHLTFYLGIPVFSYFLHSLYPAEIHRNFSRVLFVCGLIATAIVIGTPARIFTHLVTPFQLITLIAVIYWTYGIIISLIHGKEDAPLVFVGFIVLSAAAVNDMLYARGTINTGYYLSFGLLVLIFILSFTISLRFSRSFKRSEKLSEQLQHSKEQIEEYNRTLEEKIFQRSAKILEQNAFFEMQLEMAGRLQRSLLPASAPHIPEANITTLYLPSMSIGGDIYDFRRNGTSGIGIFIADVSGHGIAAALIASMVKMSLNSWEEYLEKPSLLLKEIHASLSDKIGNNFISSCACYIDFKKSMFRSSIAGHPLPIIINTQSSFRQSENKGHVISNLFSSNFTDSEITLMPGDKIILYTDGIVEARNQEGDLFGETRFFNILKNNTNLTPQKLSEKIHHDILSHIGERQEDDITMMIVQYGK